MSHFPVFKNYDAVANYPFWPILFDGYVKTAALSCKILFVISLRRVF